MDICRRKFGACILAGLTSRAWALPPRPKLLVLVVLEQIRRDYLDALGGQAGPGGLRRLLENGAYFPDCRHLAASYTSSTLATLATGAWPAQHGIVADTWFDRAARKPVRASDEALLATTLTAQIAAARDTRSYVISLDALDGALFAIIAYQNADAGSLIRGQGIANGGNGLNQFVPAEFLAQVAVGLEGKVA